MKNIIFLAPPAAGKGTISKVLKEQYGYHHISTGNLFRERIEKQDEEAKVLETLIEKGNLVDDERTFHLLKEKLNTFSENDSFILDGIPRTLQQAHILDIILRDLGFSNVCVINIQIDKEVLKKRFTGRRICKKCQSTYNIYFEKFKPHKENTCDKCGNLLTQRVDDKEESFKVRYEIFEKNNQEIVRYYNEQNCLYNVDYNEDIEDSLKEIQRIVGAFVDK